MNSETTKQILVAGVGNIFFGDDAFGVEVAQELKRHALPPGVRVIDFGIRGYDLAYALAEGYEAVILVDATARGERPGTLYLIQPDLAQLGAPEGALADAHSLHPVRVLQMAETLGGRPGRLYLVGCEPSTLESEAGRLGLSGPVQAAVPKAAEIIESLLGNLLGAETTTNAGSVPV